MKHPHHLGLLFVPFLAIALVGCKQEPPKAPQEHPPASSATVPAPAAPDHTGTTGETTPTLPTTAVYECPSNTTLTAHYENERVSAILPGGRTVDLPQVTSASGARYSDGETTLWNKGQDLSVEQPGQPLITCHEQASPTPEPAPAPAPGTMP